MRVLVLCDDYYHPARTPRAGLSGLDGAFDFDWIEDAAQWSPELMARYQVVLLTKSNNVSAADQTPWVDDAVQQALVTYVRSGKGLLAIHSGTAGYAETPMLRALLGGVFASHPAQCTVQVTPAPGHPLTAGSAQFSVFDEHYMMDMDDPSVDVFLTTDSQHGGQPGGWTRSEGDGRVCVLTPGHNLEVWLDPSYQTLIRNALTWCAGE